MPLVLALIGALMLAIMAVVTSGLWLAGVLTFSGVMFVYYAIFMLFLQTRDNAVKMHNIIARAVKERG